MCNVNNDDSMLVLCVCLGLSIEFERVLLLFYMSVIREIREVCKNVFFVTKEWENVRKK